MSALATKDKSTDLILVPKADLDEMNQLDAYSRAASRQLIAAEIERNDMSKGLIMARAMRKLRSLLTDKVMADVMELQGTPLGFRTDRDQNGGYKSEELRDVMVQALLRGLRPVHNEINVIAGNLYVTKEGFERLLREFPGLSKLAIEVGVPNMVGEGALVPCRASWVFNGEQDMLVCEKGNDADYRIPIRVNKSMGSDAIQGKAKSKLYRRIYERLTGTALGVEQSADDDPNTVDGHIVDQAHSKQAPGS
jgi:hypothetical protein